MNRLYEIQELTTQIIEEVKSSCYKIIITLCELVILQMGAINFLLFIETSFQNYLHFTFFYLKTEVIILLVSLLNYFHGQKQLHYDDVAMQLCVQLNQVTYVCKKNLSSTFIWVFKGLNHFITPYMSSIPKNNKNTALFKNLKQKIQKC